KSWLANIDEGWTRFVFDTFNIPYRSIRDADLKAGGLGAGLDVIILPSERPREIMEGNAPGTYPAEFTGGASVAGVNNLKQFVEGGGTLICFDASCDLVIRNFGLPLRNMVEGLRPSDFYCPGSILSLKVDNSQPLARGMSHAVDAYFINSAAYEATD